MGPARRPPRGVPGRRRGHPGGERRRPRGELRAGLQPGRRHEPCPARREGRHASGRHPQRYAGRQPRSRAGRRLRLHHDAALPGDRDNRLLPATGQLARRSALHRPGGSPVLSEPSGLPARSPPALADPLEPAVPVRGGAHLLPVVHHRRRRVRVLHRGHRQRLGSLIELGFQEVSLPQIYAAIFCLSLLGLAFTLLVALIERRVLSWQPARSGPS